MAKSGDVIDSCLSMPSCPRRATEICPIYTEKGPDADRLRKYSFPCWNSEDKGDGNSIPHKSRRQSAMIEKIYNMEESQSEALFNQLKQYTMNSQFHDADYSKLKTRFCSQSRKSSDASPRLSLISSQRRSSVFSNNLVSRVDSVSTMSSYSGEAPLHSISHKGLEAPAYEKTENLLTSAKGQFKHRRSTECLALPLHFQFTPKAPRQTTIEENPEPHNKTIAPDEISRNTSEQLRRNSIGRFSNLSEFASNVGIDPKKHVFAHCPETGDLPSPVLDLDTGTWYCEGNKGLGANDTRKSSSSSERTNSSNSMHDVNKHFLQVQQRIPSSVSEEQVTTISSPSPNTDSSTSENASPHHIITKDQIYDEALLLHSCFL